MDQVQPQVVTLDQVTLLQIELLELKKRLNKAEEEKLMLLLNSVRREGRVLQEDTGRMISEVLQRHRVEGSGKSLRLLDKERGLCAVE